MAKAPNTVPTVQSCDQAFGKTGFLSETGKRYVKRTETCELSTRSFAKFLLYAVTRLYRFLFGDDSIQHDFRYGYGVAEVLARIVNDFTNYGR
jgi:hypothetical protein